MSRTALPTLPPKPVLRPELSYARNVPSRRLATIEILRENEGKTSAIPFGLAASTAIQALN